MGNERQYSYTYPPFDALLQLEDGAAAFTVVRNGEVGAVERIIDFGEDDFNGLLEAPYMRADMVMLLSAMNFTGDQFYEVDFQLSSESDFSAIIVNRARFRFGAIDNGATFPTISALFPGAPFYVPITVDNQVGKFRYKFGRFRLGAIGGTAPSITLKAWLSSEPRIGGGI